MEVNRGSEWSKWDLHVHSPYTYLNGYQCSDDDFIAKLKEKNISVIGLTNYFKFTDEEYILKEKLEKEGITVFLNLELRLSYTNNNNDCCDFHVIFDNKLTKEDISRFLSNLNINLSGTQIKAIDIDSSGMERANVELDELMNRLNEKSLKIHNRFLVGFLSRGKGNARSSTNFEKVHKYTHFIIHSSDSEENIETDRAFWLKNKKPLVQCSDAHRLDQIGEKFTWIKGLKDFNGLKQIVYEPEERVQPTAVKPDEKYDYNVIDYLKFKDNDSSFFSSKPIYLNENLNAIIGGKSTGKSNLIRKMVNEVDSNEFYKDNHSIEWINQDIEVVWKNGEGINKKILYIPQSYLIKDIENGKTDISNIVLNSLKSDHVKKKIYENLDKKKDEIRSKINDIIEKIINNKNIIDKNNENIKVLGNINEVKQELDKLNKIKSQLLLETEVSEEDIKNLDTLNKSITSNKLKIHKTEKDIITLKKKLNDLGTSKNYELLKDDDMFNDLAARTLINNEYNNIIQEALLDISNSVIEHNISMFEENLKQIRKNLTEEETKVSPIKEILKNQSKIADITFKIDDIQDKYYQVESLLREVALKKSQIDSYKIEIIIEFRKYYKIKEEFIEDFEFQEGKLKIGYKISMRDTLINWLKESAINNNNSYLSNLDETFKDYILDNNYEDFVNQIKFFMNEALEDKIPFKGKFECRSFLKELFANWLDIEPVMEYENDRIEHMSDGKKAFVLLMLLINIDDSKYPIIIDQPEDSLDNRSIYKELTTYLKEKKKQRQIILVTHNANLVVGADAENIIVANQHGTSNKNLNGIKFDYINGALEDSRSLDNSQEFELDKMGTKEHVCDILEGGKDAFKKRELKYNLQNILIG